MVATTGLDEQRDVGARTTELRLETEEEVSTRQEQVMQATDKVVRSLSPLINSMKVFGLYFTRESSRVHPTSQLSWQSLRRCQSWNPARVYATVMLVVTWLSTVRLCVVFDGKETLGAELFMKVAIIPTALLVATLHTAYFVASTSGSLHRVLRGVSLRTDYLSQKYSHRAKVVTVVCWLVLTLSNIYYVCLQFSIDQFNDPSLMLLVKTFRISKTHENIMKGFYFVLQLQTMGISTFTQAMKLQCLLPSSKRRYLSLSRTRTCSRTS